ncbi:MAG: hypothetical protein WBG46_09355 [Nonlabens sp.]
MRRYFLFILGLSFIYSCEENDDYAPIIIEESPVNFDLSQVPFATLSEYNFYEGDLKDLQPSKGVLPYQLINQLFTDYAKKKRFVWMPEGTSAMYVVDDQILEFPVGAVMVKNFYYENVLPANDRRIIETRLIYRTNSGWEFADYKWNDEQTEAVLDLNGSDTQVDFIDEGSNRSINYRIPSRTECLTCHKKVDEASPIGPKPFNLNSDYTFVDGIQNQLEKWSSLGYLTDLPNAVNRLPDWKDPTLDLQERVRSYTEINCAHCHNDLGHCSYREIRFDYMNSSENQNLGVCVEPEELVGSGQTHVVRPGVARRSALFYRISTNNPAERMPLLGRSTVDEAAVQLVEDWINSLDISCN